MNHQKIHVNHHHAVRTQTVACKANGQFVHAKLDTWDRRLDVDLSVLLAQSVNTISLVLIRNAEIRVRERAEVSVRMFGLL